MEQRSLYFLGDLHGAFKFLTNNIRIQKISNATIIQVGDFGIGLIEDEQIVLDKINRVLQSANCNLLAIRGNHDRPMAFTNSQITSNIELIQDYTLRNICGLNILFIGGAVSINRISLRVGISYWHNETFVFDKDKLDAAISSCSRLDIVVTHSAPSKVSPIENDPIVTAYERVDPDLTRDLEVDRSSHDQLLNYLTRIGLKPTHWYYGHFHRSLKTLHQEIEFNLLAIDELRLHRVLK